MKTYREYDNEQLLEFNDEQISEMIDLQCALDGVPLLPPEPMPPEPLDVAPDTTVYEVAGFNFADQETAQRVAAAINAEQILNIDYDWHYDRVHYADGYSDIAAKMEAKQVFSNELYNKTRSARAEYKANKESYDKVRKEYDRVKSLRDEIANDVWGKIYTARDEEAKQAEVVQKFNRYLTLAEGDEVQARKFFQAAYPDEVHLLPVLTEDA